MRRFLAAVVVMALALPPYSVGALQAAQANGSINGKATSSTGQALVNQTVQLRSVDTGRLVGSSTVSTTGTFGFATVDTGSYVVEVVNAAGRVVGTSAAVFVAPGAAVTGVSVTQAAAVVSGIGTPTLVAILVAAGGAIAVAGVLATGGTASAAQ